MIGRRLLDRPLKKGWTPESADVVRDLDQLRQLIVPRHVACGRRQHA
jgi:hypothetical protein